MLAKITQCCIHTRYRLLLIAVVIASILLSSLQFRQVLSWDTLTTNNGFSDRFENIPKMTTYFNLRSVHNGFSQMPSPQTYTKYDNRRSVEVTTRNSGLSHRIENLTVVTAYFDLGSFKKGPSQKFSQQTYINWVKTFKHMKNTLVVYTDSKVFADTFRNLRKGMEKKTKIVLVERTRFWTFRIQDRIKKIYSQKGYPKHYPNTVLPAYSCAQHSKYALVVDAIKQKYFKSKCYAWLDIGYFRDIVNSKRSFTLNYPNDFDKHKLAVNLVYPSVSLKISYDQIVYRNQVWVGGGMFLGTADVILSFEAQYKRAVMFLLDKQLMSTDQQVILSMYSTQGRKDLNATVQLQLYSRRKNETKVKNGNPWFYLGYKCLTFM